MDCLRLYYSIHVLCASTLLLHSVVCECVTWVEQTEAEKQKERLCAKLSGRKKSGVYRSMTITSICNPNKFQLIWTICRAGAQNIPSSPKRFESLCIVRQMQCRVPFKMLVAEIDPRKWYHLQFSHKLLQVFLLSPSRAIVNMRAAVVPRMFHNKPQLKYSHS